MTEQADNYGAVKVWRDGSYYLVCADGFDSRDADVVCRNMGYPYGTSLCCDAFGHQVRLNLCFVFLLQIFNFNRKGRL